MSIANTEFRTKTDNKGRYHLSYVPGRFEVRYTKDDYEPVSIWLEFATREKVRVSSQTLPSKQARREVIEAFRKAISANIGKAKFGSSFVAHVAAAPISALLMTNPAYIKLGFEPLLTFDGADRIEVPPDARAYVDRLGKCGDIIDQARDGAIGLDDPKFLAAAEDCYPVISGVVIIVAGVLLGEGSDISVTNDIRKRVADARARKAGR